MTACVERAAWRLAVACAAALLACGSALAVPASQGDSAGAPAFPALSSVGAAPNDTDAAKLSSSPDPSVGGLSRSNAQKDAAPGAPPLEVAASAALPRRAPSTALVDEDPRVEIADVVESVARATVSAVPWLRLGAGRPQDEAQRRREAMRSESEAELALRLENSAATRAGQGPGSDSDGRRPPEPGSVNLIDEAIELARDFIANPVTWLLGVPALLALFMVALLRGRGK